MGGVLRHVFDHRFTQPATRLVLFVAGMSALSCGITGALSGWTFAAILTGAERRRNLQTISVARVAVWGALGSIGLWYGLRLIPMTVTQFLLFRGHAFSLAVAGMLGAASAAGSVLIARRASSLPGASDAAGAALDETNHPSRPLPPGPFAFHR